MEKLREIEKSLLK